MVQGGYQAKMKGVKRAIIFLVLLYSLSFGLDTLATPDTTNPESTPMNIRLEAALSADTIRLDDTVAFTVKVIIEGDPTLYTIKDFLPSVSNLKLVGSGSATKSESGSGVTLSVKEFIFKYAPSSLGMAYIEPTKVEYFFSPTNYTGQLTSTRFSITVLEPRKKGGKIPIYAWIIALVIIATGGVFFIFLSKRGAKKEEVVEEIVPVEKRLLEELKSIEGTRNSVTRAQFFSALEKILRTYILEKYSYDISGRSPKEVSEKFFELEFPESLTKNVERFLEHSNLVRFGGYSADEEWIDDALLTLQKLLEYK